MTFAPALLWPLTLPYGAWVRLRAAAYRSGIAQQKQLNGRVISVGNLTTGGTGKTPMVLRIAEQLTAEGEKTAILTRGYRGKATAGGPHSSGSHTSDEVRLLQARLGDRVRVGVGADRYRVGRELVRDGFAWFVLDDGFQHMQLARDVDIVLVDALNPFGGGQLLPAGRLREPKAALVRADVIVITRSFHAPAVEAAIRRDSKAPLFHARVALKSMHTLRKGYPGDEEPNARERKYLAFCGIGNASAFFSDLEEWGFQVVGQKTFRDHHRYTQLEVNDMAVQAQSLGADALICTEKDACNLSGIEWGALDAMYCRIVLEIDREGDFWRIVRETAERKFHARRPP